mmetsp:Transcript_92999/g.300552  ORF Transcript_92999/g.300552 Transcript_92999/m.300552 type:complete len:214 (+) Transcript_92999:144-785(+)
MDIDADPGRSLSQDSMSLCRPSLSCGGAFLPVSLFNVCGGLSICAIRELVHSSEQVRHGTRPEPAQPRLGSTLTGTVAPAATILGSELTTGEANFQDDELGHNARLGARFQATADAAEGEEELPEFDTLAQPPSPNATTSVAEHGASRLVAHAAVASTSSIGSGGRNGTRQASSVSPGRNRCQHLRVLVAAQRLHSGGQFGLRPKFHLHRQAR